MAGDGNNVFVKFFDEKPALQKTFIDLQPA
jgi:hypothetical protein